MSYRDASPTPDLERRIESLESKVAREMRSSLGAWLFYSTLVVVASALVVGLSGLIWSSCSSADVETRRRCEEVCRLHHMRVLWIEGDGPRVGEVCVCGRDSIDGGVIESYSSWDGNPTRPR